VSQAGAVLLMETIAAVGLDTALSAGLTRWRPRLAVHDPAKVLLDTLYWLARSFAAATGTGFEIDPQVHALTRATLELVSVPIDYTCIDYVNGFVQQDFTGRPVIYRGRHEPRHRRRREELGPVADGPYALGIPDLNFFLVLAAPPANDQRAARPDPRAGREECRGHVPGRRGGTRGDDRSSTVPVECARGDRPVRMRTGEPGRS
jgi:hypothetical protein